VHSSDPARRGYEEALALILEAEPFLSFSVENLCKLHEKVFYYLDNSGGHFKKENNQLFRQTEDGALSPIHTPLPAKEIPVVMNQFIQRYREAMNAQIHDPLVIISLTLMDYIFIHPFFDGNGRTFRLLSVLLLREAGFDYAGALHFDKVLQNSRGSGQAALKVAMAGWKDGKHNPLPWIHYFLGALSYAHTQRVVGAC